MTPAEYPTFQTKAGADLTKGEGERGTEAAAHNTHARERFARSRMHSEHPAYLTASQDGGSACRMGPGPELG